MGGGIWRGFSRLLLGGLLTSFHFFFSGFQIELDTPGPDEGRKDTPLSWPNLLINIDLLSYNLAEWQRPWQFSHSAVLDLIQTWIWLWIIRATSPHHIF